MDIQTPDGYLDRTPLTRTPQLISKDFGYGVVLFLKEDRDAVIEGGRKEGGRASPSPRDSHLTYRLNRPYEYS